jgi:glycosyltransferase involved in cell wall biosynthesis
MLKHEVTGLLCEVGDWEGLANNVIRLLRDNKLASVLAQNAYETVKQYTWATVRERWLEVYESLLTPKGPSCCNDQRSAHCSVLQLHE